MDARLLHLLLEQGSFIESLWQKYNVVHEHWFLRLDGQSPAARVEYEWQSSDAIRTHHSLETGLSAWWQDEDLTLLGLSISVRCESDVGVHVVPIEADIASNDLVQPWLLDAQVKQNLFLNVRKDGVSPPREVWEECLVKVETSIDTAGSVPILDLIFVLVQGGKVVRLQGF